MTRQFLKCFLAVTILVAAIEPSNAQNTTTTPLAVDNATKQETPAPIVQGNWQANTEFFTSGVSPCLHYLRRPPWSYRLRT